MRTPSIFSLRLCVFAFFQECHILPASGTQAFMHARQLIMFAHHNEHIVGV